MSALGKTSGTRLSWKESTVTSSGVRNAPSLEMERLSVNDDKKHEH
jgi:hypothetical protein